MLCEIAGFLVLCVWQNLVEGRMPRNFLSGDLVSWALSNLKLSKQQHRVPWNVIFAVTLWLLWFWRNCHLHNMDVPAISQTRQLILGKAKAKKSGMFIILCRQECVMLI